MNEERTRNSAGEARARRELASGIEREFAERESLESSLDDQASQWRDVVANRVEGYRSRRSKKSLAGEFSMKFDFGTPPPNTREGGPRPAKMPRAFSALPAPLLEPEPEPPASSPASETIPTLGNLNTFAHSSSVAGSPAAAVAAAVQPDLPAPPDSRAGSAAAGFEHEKPAKQPPPPPRETKVIEFPRSLVFPEFAEPSFFDRNELAEPVLDKPRILDVPDTVSLPAPPLADLALETDVEEDPLPAPQFDLPLRVAPLPNRITAALADWTIVLAATAIFVMIVARSVTDLPHSKPLIGLAVAVPVLFWAVYQYLFLVHAAITPGMQIARLRMSTFEGTHAPRRLRRWRALMMVLSCASLGFGYFWALIDEDNLCWHDKMTRTYMTWER